MDAYNAISDNLASYTNVLSDLRLTSDIFMDNVKKKYASEKIGNLIELSLETNRNLEFGENDVKGMTITKKIIPTKANTEGTDLSKYLIVKPKGFVYNPRTYGKKIGLGFNNTENTFIISWNNIAFHVSENAKNFLFPEYLYIYFKRDEWDRMACFSSWGSSTEVFSWETLCEMKIILPPLSIQQSIVDIYHAQFERQEVADKLNNTLREICPILIKQSLAGA